MRLLADDVDRFARRHGLRRGVEAAAVLKAARAAADVVLPRDLRPLVAARSFRNGTLTLEAPSGVPLANLHAHREAVRDECNRALGRAVVVKVLARATIADERPDDPSAGVRS